MRGLLSLLLVFSCGVSYADKGLDDLDLSFENNKALYIKLLDAAESIKPIETKLGTPLPKEDCEEIKNKAIAAATINPFNFAYETGSAHTYMCGGNEMGTLDNFIVQQAGKLPFSNLDYQFVVQLQGFDKRSHSNYFFDSAYKIVQIENLIYDRNGKLNEFAVQTKDPTGNYLRNYYAERVGFPQRKITGSWSVQSWIAATGVVPFALFRDRIVSKDNANNSYEALRFSRTDKKDWENFELPITHAWTGHGYYVYDGKFYTSPRYVSSLWIKKRDGKKVCSYGNIYEDKTSKQFPADNKDYYDCFNY